MRTGTISDVATSSVRGVGLGVAVGVAAGRGRLALATLECDSFGL
jgi:hypothetical protein